MEGKESSSRNVRERVGLFVDRPMADCVRRINTQIQPVDHMGAEQIIWQRVLEGTEGGKAKEILEIFQATPEQPFLDKEYQDWLERKGVLKRQPKDSEAMQVLRNMAGKLGMKKRISQSEQLFLMLMSEEGYFVSLDRLITALEGDRWDLENLDGGGAVDLSKQKFRLKQLLKQGLGPLMTNDILFQVNAVGIGVGIEDFKLNHQEISLLHHFYSNPGRLVSHLPHRRNRMGEVVNEGNSLAVVVSRLNKKATDGEYLFKIKPNRGLGSYKLEELDDIHKVYANFDIPDNLL